MSDLISREQAIDAADRADYTGLAVEDVKKVTDEVVKELKQLPSAEPEIIRCKDCVFKYFNEIEDDYFCGRFGMRILQQIDDNCFCSWAERKEDE